MMIQTFIYFVQYNNYYQHITITVLFSLLIELTQIRNKKNFLNLFFIEFIRKNLFYLFEFLLRVRYNGMLNWIEIGLKRT